MTVQFDSKHVEGLETGGIVCKKFQADFSRMDLGTVLDFDSNVYCSLLTQQSLETM